MSTKPYPGEHINADPQSAFKAVMKERDDALAALADVTSMGLVAQRTRDELRERVVVMLNEREGYQRAITDALAERDSWRGKFESQAAETLIDAWARIHARAVPWKTAVGIVGVLTHLDEAEILRLLNLDESETT